MRNARSWNGGVGVPTIRPRRLSMEMLENREMLSITVVNDYSSGTGSLYWAIEQANLNPGPDEIEIDQSITNINLTQALPTITDSVSITSLSVTYEGTIISDSSAGGITCGLCVDTEGDIQLGGLFLTGFDRGLHVEDVGDITIENCTFDSNEDVGILFCEGQSYPTTIVPVSVGHVVIGGGAVKNNGGHGIAIFVEDGVLNGIEALVIATEVSGNDNGEPTADNCDGIHLVGLRPTDDQYPLGRFRITGSEIGGNGRHGLYLHDCSGAVVLFNHFGGPTSVDPPGNGDAGVHLEGETSGVEVLANRFLGNGGNAIEVEGIDIGGEYFPTGNVFLTQYEFSDNGGAPISLTPKDTYGRPLCQHGIPAPWISIGSLQANAEDYQFQVSFNAGTLYAGKSVKLQMYYADVAAARWDHRGEEDSFDVTLDAQGNYSGLFSVSKDTLGEFRDGVAFTATWTGDTYRDTSEMSNYLQLLDGEVEGRHVFYNDSYLDGYDDDANSDDDDAIDATKTALLSATGPVSTANVTGYSQGINGIMIDISDIPNPDDIEYWLYFHVGTQGTWSALDSSWVDTVDVRLGDGVNGSDRVTVIFKNPDPFDPDYGKGILDQWLRVTIPDNGYTGLLDADVFYFGNLVADTNGDRAVGSTDLDAVYGNWGSSGRLISTGDINLDNTVNANDLDIVRANWGHTLALPYATSAKSLGLPSSAGAAVDAVFAEDGKDDKAPRWAYDPILDFAGDRPVTKEWSLRKRQVAQAAAWMSETVVPSVDSHEGVQSSGTIRNALYRLLELGRL